MPKKTAVFLIAFFLVLAGISAPCFCAHSANPVHQVTIQKSHSCCPSNSDSHCKTHLAKLCFTSEQKTFVFPVSQINHEAGVNFTSLPQDVTIDLAAGNFFQPVPFFKPQNKLFLQNEVLRI